jgi:pimeloyl-ACP methyl ester carboxylesterase
MASAVNIQGVKFFTTSADCVSHFEHMSWMSKVVSWIQSLGRACVALLKKPTQFLSGRIHPQIRPYTAPLPAGASKPVLLVCLHGLNHTPNQFRGLVSELEQYNLSQVHIYIPAILNRGHAPLDAAVQPIFAEIATWAQTSGDKELILVGISNGGRIARALDAKLTTSKHVGNIRKLRLISLVGACNGSSLVNIAHRCRLSRLMHKSIATEMPLHSPRNLQLDREFLDNLEQPNGLKRDYTFFASPHDWFVPDYASTLPTLPSHITTRYSIIPGYGHDGFEDSAVNAVATLSLNTPWP